jgi:flagellar assembly factor FliW
MRINTSRFGEIEVEDESVVYMAEGMLGFTEYRKFVLIRHNEGSPFLWYQAVEEPNLAFVIVDPFTFFPDYEVLLSREDLDALQATELGNLAVFSVVVIPENPEDMTANLRGPVLINVEKKTARQVVLNDERYSPHQPILETVRGAVARSEGALAAGVAPGAGTRDSRVPGARTPDAGGE